MFGGVGQLGTLQFSSSLYHDLHSITSVGDQFSCCCGGGVVNNVLAWRTQNEVVDFCAAWKCIRASFSIVNYISVYIPERLLLSSVLGSIFLRVRIQLFSST